MQAANWDNRAVDLAEPHRNTANQACTVVVVSHVDLRAHQDANELIGLQSYPDWRQRHHECTFTLNGAASADSQMRLVIIKS